MVESGESLDLEAWKRVDINVSQLIFRTFFEEPQELIDRFVLDGGNQGVDVVIPLINTNPLFKRNLLNFYQEIPIHRLLIGDGGVRDDSLEILKLFPRVEVVNHADLVSQGASIVDLIRRVQTPEFVYLHADVFLPEGWYQLMRGDLSKYDWFECPHFLTVMVEFWKDPEGSSERAYSGAQMGKTDVVSRSTRVIEDDFLQRNEDIIISELVEKEGGTYGRSRETFHYHQVMNRDGAMEPKFFRVDVHKQIDEAWERRIFEMQYKGIIKYLKPTKKYLVREVLESIVKSIDLGSTSRKELKAWVRDVDPSWLPFIRDSSILRLQAIHQVKRIGRRFLSS